MIVNTIALALIIGVSIFSIFAKSIKIYALIVCTFLALIGILTYDGYVKASESKAQIDKAMEETIERFNKVHLAEFEKASTEYTNKRISHSPKVINTIDLSEEFDTKHSLFE